MRRREPPAAYLDEIMVREDMEAHGAVPPIGRGNESVAETLSEIDMDKSTERQLMTDMSGLDVWRGSRF